MSKEKKQPLRKKTVKEEANRRGLDPLDVRIERIFGNTSTGERRSTRNIRYVPKEKK